MIWRGIVRLGRDERLWKPPGSDSRAPLVMSGVISGMRIRIASAQGNSQVGRYVKGKFGETLNDTQLILVISSCELVMGYIGNGEKCAISECRLLDAASSRSLRLSWRSWWSSNISGGIQSSRGHTPHIRTKRRCWLCGKVTSVDYE